MSARAAAVAQHKEHVVVPVPLVLAVIHTESTGNPRAVSKHGALGLMQLLPATARWLGVDDPMDPQSNIAGGTLYLAKLMKMFARRLDLAVASYNAGPGAVQRAGNRIPLDREETRRYVPLVLDRMRLYEHH